MNILKSLSFFRSGWEKGAFFKMSDKAGFNLFAVALAISALILSPAASDAPQNQAQQTLRHDAAAVVKLVPVRVLDGEGRPVRGLRKEDFVLYDNGELKIVTEFEVHESGETRIAAEEAAAAETPARPEVKRKYFFVLDMQGSDIFGNRDSKNAVLEFVENQLKLGDEASVMTFGALTGLVLRQYLTSDLDKIKKAIRRSIEMGGGGGGGVSLASGGGVDPGREDDVVEGRGGAGQEVAGGGLEGQAEGGRTVAIKGREADDSPFGGRTGIQLDTAGGGWYARAARTKADFDMSMMELAKAMKYISGTKSVVYFSMRTPGKDVSRQFVEANTTIYAVNTNSIPAKGGGPGASLRREMKKRQGEALTSFAEASGGHYFADVKEAKTIAKEVEVLSGNYYVLGYYIRPSWDGRLHQIKVEVKQPGLRVLAQAGYNDPKPFAALSDLEKKLQLFDLALSDKPVTTEALDLPVEVMFGSTMKEANTAVLLKLAVDERAGVPAGKTELFTFVFDKEHKIVLGERGEMDSTPHAQKTLFPYLLTWLQPGDYEVRVLARAMGTGQSAASRLSFTVPAPAAASRMSLLSPFLMVPGKKAEYVRMSRPTIKAKEPISIIRFYPFLPSNCTPLVDDLPPDADKIWVLLPLDYGTGEMAETDLDVKLVRADDGEEITVDWGLIDTQKAEQGKDFLLIGIGLPALKPGAYRLEFSLTEIKSGAKASATARFGKK
jgi:VWFA-related protein